MANHTYRQSHHSHRPLIELLAAASLMQTPALLVQMARAEPAQQEPWQTRRELLLRLRQQQQLHLQQQVLCLQKAGTDADLKRCSTVVMPGWMHGPGMGGWGCPMW